MRQRFMSRMMTGHPEHTCVVRGLGFGTRSPIASTRCQQMSWDTGTTLVKATSNVAEATRDVCWMHVRHFLGFDVCLCGGLCLHVRSVRIPPGWDQPGA